MRQIMNCEVIPGKSIKQILQNKYNMSAALITSLKKHDEGILVNGEKKYVNYILQEGDKLTVTFTETGSVNIEPVSMPIDILYEDEHILAVNKPAHMAVHVSFQNVYNTLSNGVLHYLNRDGHEHTFHVVTRLDKNTSGVVLIAKNAYMHDMLGKQLRNRTLYKEYIALVNGRITDNGEVNAPIARENDSIIKRCVKAGGDEAASTYEVLENGDMYTLVKLMPATGRTHQLRVHMAYIGHPIVGDDMYGADIVNERRQFLHCERIRFIHPLTRENLEIYQKAPDFFWEYLYKN